MKITRSLVWGGLVALSTAGMLVLAWAARHPPETLPYHDSFALHRAQEWIPIGGFWRLQDGEVINGSDAAGSKLITGSPNWTDYQMTATLRLLAHGGDVGVILRVSDATIGPNAYRGYYVGLRSNDASLVVGRANYSWLEDHPVFMGEPVQTGRWYRLHVVAVGCALAVEALDLTTGVRQRAAMQDGPRTCITHGKAGLRSTDTGSAWKNISIEQASRTDLDQILAFGPALLKPEYPVQERDLNRMRSLYSPENYPYVGQDEDARAITMEALEKTESVPPTTALELRTALGPGSRVRLHGVITSISPFYLQDATGGIRLVPPDPGVLCVGDEVDAIGRLVDRKATTVFAAEGVVESGDRAALTPFSISPAQAASGVYEGSLVEVMGQLVSREVQPDGSAVLALHADGQNFEALVRNDPFASRRRRLQTGSSLRIRGISTVSTNAQTGSSFTVLVQSGADIEVLAGPSWLQGWRLLLLAASGLLASGAAVYQVMHSSRVKASAIAAERERLSHEVHDTLAQSFAGISFRLQGLRKQARVHRLTQDRLVEELEEIYQVVAGTHQEASAFIAALHPDAHGNSDLLTLIQRASTNLFVKNGPAIRTHLCGEPRTLDPVLVDVLFRVALEGIANVLRHSQASTVELCLKYSIDTVTLSLRDDGIGFSPNAVARHFGLQMMHKRCESIQAAFTIESAPGRGTCLSATAPYKVRSRARNSAT